MFKKILKLCNIFRPKLDLSDFKYIVNNINNNKRITYLHPINNNLDIGYIEYNIYSGKICLFFITQENYRNKSLGKQILENILIDIKNNGNKRAWLVTSKYPHPFWEKNGFTYANPPDKSVTFHGYIRDL